MNVKYKAKILLKGEIANLKGVDENIDMDIFKELLNRYLEKTLECKVEIEECMINVE